MAAAWVYMLHGCKTGSVVSVGASYVLAAACVIYKAQFFIANSYLILVFPAFFFKSLSWKTRVTWLVSCTILYIAALKLAEGIRAMPSIELDGRGLLRRSEWIIDNFDNPWIRELLTLYLPQQGDSPLYSALWILVMAAILLVITFGCFLLLYAALAWWLRKAENRMVLLFPLLIISVYMFMSVGLNLNVSTTGNQDELIHRPFVWAYFVVCTWVGGGAWIAVSRWRPESRWPAIATAIVPLLVLVPWILGRGIVVDTPGAWNNAAQWAVPAGLVKAAYFIRDHSRATDIVQDSQGDWRRILCGLSERQLYALWQLSVPEDVLAENDKARMLEFVKSKRAGTYCRRSTEIASRRYSTFMTLTREKDILEFARHRHIRWFVSHPDDILAGHSRSLITFPSRGADIGFMNLRRMWRSSQRERS